MGGGTIRITARLWALGRVKHDFGCLYLKGDAVSRMRAFASAKAFSWKQRFGDIGLWGSDEAFNREEHKERAQRA